MDTRRHSSIVARLISPTGAAAQLARRPSASRPVITGNGQGNWQDFATRMSGICMPIGVNPNYMYGTGGCGPNGPAGNMPPNAAPNGAPGNSPGCNDGPCGPGAPRWTQIGGSNSPPGGIPVQGLVDVTITVRAPFKGQRMLIPSSLAPLFTVVGIFVGPQPVLIDSGEVDGELYASNQDTAGRIQMPWAPVNQIVRVQLRNVSPAIQPTARVSFEGDTVTPYM